MQGKRQYLILWEGYKREESSWVEESNLNERAIKSVSVQIGAVLQNLVFAEVLKIRLLL